MLRIFITMIALAITGQRAAALAERIHAEGAAQVAQVAQVVAAADPARLVTTTTTTTTADAMRAGLGL